MSTGTQIRGRLVRRVLGFRDLLFLSFGGQAPFISLLTFGTVMIILVGDYGAFAMLLATLVVLLNGAVVYFLTKRFRRGGGYYTYAFYALTPRIGFNMGWSYILYSLAYGGTLLSGGAYVLYTVLRTLLPPSSPILQQWFIALIVSSLAAAIVLCGVRVSARYAEAMSIAEIVALITLSIVFLYDSGWRFYNPIPTSMSPKILAAVVFGLGIPTGYGSIAPLGEDAEAKNIGKAAVSVLLLGGLLATFFFYSLGAMRFTGSLINYLLLRFGLVGLFILGFIAFNDGALGGVSYILANSRTIEAMSRDRFFPTIFSRLWNNRPIAAETIAAALFISVLTLTAYKVGLLEAFTFLGALAGLINLFVHMSANVSLIRVSSKRIRKHIHEVLVGIVASVISLWVFFYSLPQFYKYVVYLFLGWIILGFFIGEGLDVLRTVERGEEQ